MLDPHRAAHHIWQQCRAASDAISAVAALEGGLRRLWDMMCSGPSTAAHHWVANVMVQLVHLIILCSEPVSHRDLVSHAVLLGAVSNSWSSEARVASKFRKFVYQKLKERRLAESLSQWFTNDEIRREFAERAQGQPHTSPYRKLQAMMYGSATEGDYVCTIAG